MNDIDLMRRLDIEDIEKHIGDKILSECFVLETLPLVRDLSQKFVKLLESSKSDQKSVAELIEASGKLQRCQQLCEFEHASLLVACQAHHQIIKPLSEVQVAYIRHMLRLSQNKDTYYFENGILVRQFQENTRYSQAKREQKCLDRLNIELTHCLQEKTLVVPLSCSFDIYGQCYTCYSYPNIDFSRLVLRRGPFFKLIKNETARQVAQSLMGLARQSRVKDFTDKVATHLQAFEDPGDPNLLFLTGFEKMGESR